MMFNLVVAAAIASGLVLAYLCFINLFEILKSSLY